MENYTSNKKLTVLAQSLRKNMTEQERKLWFSFLKDLPFTVHRQKVISNYIFDFYIDKFKIAIELDGSQHYDDRYSSNDLERDQYLNSLGIKVLRYSNKDVNEHFSSVCEDILLHFN